MFFVFIRKTLKWLQWCQFIKTYYNQLFYETPWIKNDILIWNLKNQSLQPTKHHCSFFLEEVKIDEYVPYYKDLNNFIFRMK